MTDNLSYVFVNLNNQDHLVGKLWFHQNNGKQSTSFKYDELWLKSDYCYPLDPFLQLIETTYHTESPKILYGPFSDCASRDMPMLIGWNGDGRHAIYN